jgi:magnesium transporter
LLQQDDLMLALLLTEQDQARRTGKPVAFSRHEHVELLLGVYARQLSNVRLETQYLLGRLQAKQEFVALALAGYRNRLIRVNVHLGIATVALGVGTATAGFFGMNLANGFEHVPHAFGTVVALSGLCGLLVATGSLSYLSGRSMKLRATQRLDEIETISSALGDLSAVDYAIKSVTEEGKSLDREQFRLLLSRARKSHTTEKEVDILFNVLDKVPDGTLTTDDFRSWQGSQCGRGGGGVPKSLS